MTIHLEKLHLGTNGKQTSHRVNEVKSLFSLFIQSKWKITKTDRNRWNQISVACWWTVTQGKKHSIFTSRTSFFFPDEDLSHTASKSRFEHQKVCLHESRSRACVCSRVIFVFSVKRVNESMQMSMVWYSRGEIFSLFAMCDYVKANFRVTQEPWGGIFWMSVPWDVGLNKMSPCCLSPQQEGDTMLLLYVHGKILREH